MADFGVLGGGGEGEAGLWLLANDNLSMGPLVFRGSQRTIYTGPSAYVDLQHKQNKTGFC